MRLIRAKASTPRPIPSAQSSPSARRRLSGGDGLALALASLAAAQVLVLTGNDVGGLLNDLLALGEDQFDVAWVGHVWVDLRGISGRE